MNKYVCIHGHFYQPPRENAWLEEIELQDSAHPFHDWNERINAECYGPNAASRILDQNGNITKITNNYAHISFNMGPTLLSWMEEHAPEAYEAILEADEESREIFDGHGSAVAQAYNHIILPLANSRDKETQIKWGVHDFKSRFGRMPEGMWLAETAVDTESLEIMAAEGIKYTILAPRQASKVRKMGASDWTDVSDSRVDPRRPYLCRLPSGNTINLFFYDGGVAQDVAFNNLLSNGQHLADRLLQAFGDSKDFGDEPQLVHIATDGESYGHHHRHGEMALSYCLEHIREGDQATITNYGQFLEVCPPTWEAQIVEDSSWSCVHGVERWRSNCGCETGGGPGWNQHWRAPLRESLDWLRDELISVYEREAAPLLKDPWEARNQFITVVMDRQEGTIARFLEAHATHPLNKRDRNRAMRLLELQRNAMLMYTSCGWFFNEISGIETTQILQYACRAMQLAQQTSGPDLEEEFISRIERAESNLPEHKNGAEIYRKFVMPTRLDLKRVGMHFAISTLFEPTPDKEIFNYEVTTLQFQKLVAGVQKLSVGTVQIKSVITLSVRQFSFAVLHIGQHNIIGNILQDMEDGAYIAMSGEITHAFDESRLGDVIGIMQDYFGPDKYTIWHLFKDEKRKVLNLIMEENLEQLEGAFRRIVNSDYQLLNALRTDEIPIPVGYRKTIDLVLNRDLHKGLSTSKPDLNNLDRLAGEIQKWTAGLDDAPGLNHSAAELILAYMHKITKRKVPLALLQELNRLFAIVRKLGLSPDISRAQNSYFSLATESESFAQTEEEWKQEFERLGQNLQVKLPA